MHRQYFSSFDDLLIRTIGPDTAGNNESWAIFVNFRYINIGGCQQQVIAGDDILFALVTGQAEQVVPLKLSGPIRTPANHGVTLMVTDGRNGGAIEDAQVIVRGVRYTSARDGTVTLSFNNLGTYVVIASKNGSIRSNKVVIDVNL
jgi:hypothetical protein